MHLFIGTVCLLATLVNTGFAPLSNGIVQTQNFATFKASNERRERAEREWKRLLESYNLPDTPPDFYPITHTVRSLGPAANQIQIIPPSENPSPPAEAVRIGVKLFLERWRELLGAGLNELSLVEAREADHLFRLTFKQVGYLFPIASPYGELTLIVNDTGKLVQFEDRLIPFIDIPLRPLMEREAVAKLLINREFTYSDIAGRPQRVRINGREEIQIKRLVIFPLERDNALNLHLAWQLQVGQSLTWTVYLNAITGEELKAEQNFQT